MNAPLNNNINFVLFQQQHMQSSTMNWQEPFLQGKVLLIDKPLQWTSFDAVKKITRWAKSKGLLKKIEVLTFVDGNTSIEWMTKAGARVMNLLTKGSLNHLTHQLKKTPAQHFAEIAAVIAKAKKKGIECNVYLEDWSNGMRNSPEYVFQYLDFITKQPVKRIMLPDTLGILEPNEVKHFLQMIIAR